MLKAEEYDAAAQTVANFRRRVMPLLFLAYLMNFIDRTNISYAQLQMGSELGISLAAYGLGAGLFFIGYAGSCVPANLMLRRIGARRWIAALVIAWGGMSCLMAGMQGERSFYLLRFCLGLVEGGFAPAVSYYIASWMPPRYRSRVNALLIMAIPLGLIIGGPLAGSLLNLRYGLPGWRWLFLLEGVPTIVIGLLILRVLPSTPRDASWVDDRQRRALHALMQAEAGSANDDSKSVWHGFAVFRQPVLWGMLAVLLIAYAATFALIYFLPIILKAMYHITPLQIGALLSLPNIAAFVISYLVGRSSERFGDTRWHLAAVCLMGSAGFFMLNGAAAISMAAFLAVVSLINAYTIAYYGPLNASIQNLIGAKAGPLALVTTIGSLGGFFGPTLTGRMMQMTGDWRSAAIVFGCVTLASALLAIVCVRGRRVRASAAGQVRA
ncbi:MFS transporter [Paraburkholderia fungorum]